MIQTSQRNVHMFSQQNMPLLLLLKSKKLLYFIHLKLNFCITRVEVFRSRSFKANLFDFEKRSQSFEVKIPKLGIRKFSNFYLKYFKVFSKYLPEWYQNIQI